MPTKLIFFAPKENRYSVNVLAGAFDAAGIPGMKAEFPETPEKLAAAIDAAGSRGGRTIAAFSFLTSQAQQTAALLKTLRRRPGTSFIAGGPHASAEPQETLEMGFDCVVAGEGEQAFTGLLKKAAGGVTMPRGIIKGRPLKDLDTYTPFSVRYGLLGPIEITRGCPFGCSYCQTAYLFGTRPRHRTPGNVLKHVETLLKAGGKEIRFVSPDAFGYGSPDGRAMNFKALEEMMTGAGALADKFGGRVFFGSFPSETRPEHVTPEGLELIKRIVTNRRLVIGAQTGSPRLLKAIRRGHGVTQIIRAAVLCRAWKFTPQFDFIFGLPGETENDETETMRLILELEKLGARIHTHAFMPLPGTPLAGAGGPFINRRVERFITALEERGHAFGKWRA